MTIDYIMLGQRIGYLRSQKGLSQEALAEKANLSREFISMIEGGKTGIGVESLVDIANALEVTSDDILDSLINIANSLGVSADDILVDCLKHSTSTANSELHRLLLDCTETEEYILTQTVKALKAILSSRGI